MSVARDAITASAALFNGDTNIDHTPVGTPRGVIVLIAQNGADADEIAGITYGGVAMARPTNGYAKDTATEFMAAYAYFLGSGIPTGTQTVAIDTSGATGDKWAWIISLTAAADTSVVDSEKVEENAADPTVTLVTPASVETYVAAIYQNGFGTVAAYSPITGYTARGSNDWGQQTVEIADIDANASGGDVSAGWNTGAVSDDCALVALAIREVAAPVVGNALAWIRA